MVAVAEQHNSGGFAHDASGISPNIFTLGELFSP
jgi:hypothetical protein